MYCRNCGNEILETDKYCEKCGNEIIKNVENNNNSSNNMGKPNSNAQLPMNWWNFWKYFRFPAGCIISFLNLVNYQDYTFDFYISSFFIIDILRIILMGVSYYQFIEKKKSGYKLFNIFLAIDSIYISAFSALELALKDSSTKFVVNFAFLLIALAVIWGLPNYIYFKKRKDCFCND